MVQSSAHHLEHEALQLPPLVFWQETLKALLLVPASEQRWPLSPSMTSVVLCEVALGPAQLKPTLLLAPKLAAVMVALPGVTVRVAALMPHEPLQA